MNNQTEFHHLIVGDGVTALALIEALSLSAGDRLTVVGRTAAALGRGAAYASEPKADPWQYAYLLNSPADDIDPAFAQWAEANFATIQTQMQGRQPNWLASAQALIAKGDYAGLNYPRSVFGDFLEAQAQAALGKLRAQGVKISLLSDEATAIARTDTGFELTLASGGTVSADQVDVAPGAPSTQRISGDDSAFSAPTLFGHEARIAEHIRAGQEIFCIGTNATMLDSLRLCQSLVDDADISLVACSPSGGLPAALIPQLPRPNFTPKLTQGHKTAESFLSELRQQIEAAERSGLAIREVRAGARAFFVAHSLTDYVADPEEARKVPARLRHWLRAGTRDSIHDFERLATEGRTRLLSGAVTAIESHAAGATVIYRDKFGETHRYETGFVINCSGSVMTAGHDPLTQNMIDQGILEVSAAGYVVGARCETAWPKLRHLSPATAKIGSEHLAMPLFDAHLLRVWAQRCHGNTPQ